MPHNPIDSRFFAPRTPVAVVDYGDTGGALLVRALLEGMGAVMTFHQPGTPEDFLLILGQGDVTSTYLVLCGHGDDVGFVFGDYGSGIDTSSLVGESMPSASVTARARLDGRVVVSTGCLTGTEAFGRAFIDGGARAYIAPEDYPDGTTPPHFLHHLFHHLLVHGTTLERAWQHAAGYDDESRMFVLFTSEGLQRITRGMASARLDQIAHRQPESIALPAAGSTRFGSTVRSGRRMSRRAGIASMARGRAVLTMAQRRRVGAMPMASRRKR